MPGAGALVEDFKTANLRLHHVSMSLLMQTSLPTFILKQERESAKICMGAYSTSSTSGIFGCWWIVMSPGEANAFKPLSNFYAFVEDSRMICSPSGSDAK